MPVSTKDKRTKEQILKLLDNAIEQEEHLVERIKALESDLTKCLKKADDPRHELTEEAMPASKVSFRIDYYRTSEKSPLKGIIEHLPSRQNKSFEGEGQTIINQFIGLFLTEETGKDQKKKTTAGETIAPASVSAKSKKARLLKEIAAMEEETSASGTKLLQRLKAEFIAQNEGANKILLQMQT